MTRREMTRQERAARAGEGMKILYINVTPTEHKAVKIAAINDGKKITTWCREAILGRLKPGAIQKARSVNERPKEPEPTGDPDLNF